jgi:hypothetical protein
MPSRARGSFAVLSFPLLSLRSCFFFKKILFSGPGPVPAYAYPYLSSPMAPQTPCYDIKSRAGRATTMHDIRIRLAAPSLGYLHGVVCEQVKIPVPNFQAEPTPLEDGWGRGSRSGVGVKSRVCRRREELELGTEPSRAKRASRRWMRTWHCGSGLYGISQCFRRSQSELSKLYGPRSTGQEFRHNFGGHQLCADTKNEVLCAYFFLRRCGTQHAAEHILPYFHLGCITRKPLPLCSSISSLFRPRSTLDATFRPFFVNVIDSMISAARTSPDGKTINPCPLTDLHI